MRLSLQEHSEEPQKAPLAQRRIPKHVWVVDVKQYFPSSVANPRDRPRNATIRFISVVRLKHQWGRTYTMESKRVFGSLPGCQTSS